MAKKQTRATGPLAFRMVRAPLTAVMLLSWYSAAFLSRGTPRLLSSSLTIAKDPAIYNTFHAPSVNGDSRQQSAIPHALKQTHVPQNDSTTFRNPTAMYITSPPQVKGDSQRLAIFPQAPKVSSLPPLGNLVDDERFDARFNGDSEKSTDGATPTCRVVTRSDTKLSISQLTSLNLFNASIFSRLDAIYHAIAHEETRQLQYMQQHHVASAVNSNSTNTEEQKMVGLTREVLENAGFQRLSRRDIDLCDALNAGYLLRLSLLPDLKDLDPKLFSQFFPELVDENGKLLDDEELLFDGRLLIYWRGYSEEVSNGRLLLPKLDYLQASLVQRSAAWLRQKLNIAERWIVMRITSQYQQANRSFRSLALSISSLLPRGPIADAIRLKLERKLSRKTARPFDLSSGRRKLFTLARYGGSKMRFVGSPDPSNALDPFVICADGVDCAGMGASSREPVNGVEDELYRLLQRGDLKCAYDDDDDDGIVSEESHELVAKRPSMQLLRRVSIGSLVDLFSKDGRRKLFNTLISKSKLVEPTFKEVVVIWRSLPKKVKQDPLVKVPMWAYDVADMFDIDGLPPKPAKPTEPSANQLEIRAFSNVPMANLPAVLPKTKLIFRPADAFVFDSVTLLSLALVVGSFRFDNPRLDLLALVSGTLWLIRTFFRYSNKLARYDLLVKTFLTSKITHRNVGALKYVATEAGSQRALRASLLHGLLTRAPRLQEMEPVERDELIRQCGASPGRDFGSISHAAVDLDAALNDLEALKLIRSTRDGRYVVVRDSPSVLAALKQSWCNQFDVEVAKQAGVL